MLSKSVRKKLTARMPAKQESFGRQIYLLYRYLVALEDDLMRMFGSDRIAKIMDRMGIKDGEVIQHSMITNSIERAQKRVEMRNFDIRKHLLEYDDVMNKQREVIYKRRGRALEAGRAPLSRLRDRRRARPPVSSVVAQYGRAARTRG